MPYSNKELVLVIFFYYFCLIHCLYLVIGVGWRPGFDKGVSYGMYAKIPKATENEYEEWTNTAIALILAQEKVVSKYLTQKLENRKDTIEENELPHLLDTWATNLLVTLNYCVGMHFDSDVSKAYAWGSWHERHSTKCTNKQSCQHGWYFVFPEYKIAIRLQHNTFICWDSPNVLHGTVLDKTVNNPDTCCDSSVYSAITQIKNMYMQRVLGARKKNK